MEREVAGIFNGTAVAIQYVCIGFEPDWVWVQNLEVATFYAVEWDRNMERVNDCVEGMLHHTAVSVQAAATKGTGILPYIGGEVLTSTMQASTTYGEATYIERDDNDYRFYNPNTNGTGDAVAEDITTWTLGSATNYTGNFNEDVNGTYIGEGSPIHILTNTGQLWQAAIVALTAGAGEAANEVTLSRAVPSGKVQFIGGKYGYKPCTVGKVTKPGFMLTNTSINVNDDMISFRAGMWR